MGNRAQTFVVKDGWVVFGATMHALTTSTQKTICGKRVPASTSKLAVRICITCQRQRPEAVSSGSPPDVHQPSTRPACKDCLSPKEKGLEFCRDCAVKHGYKRCIRCSRYFSTNPKRPRLRICQRCRSKRPARASTFDGTQSLSVRTVSGGLPGLGQHK